LELQEIDRLYGMYRTQKILNVDIPEVSIPVAPGRNLSIIVEGAVRNQVLKNTGYDASQDFVNRQRELIGKLGENLNH
jgi:HPr kinase/phosphorylase